MTECFCSVSLGACFSMNAERSVIDLRVLTAECTLKFRKLRMTQYAYRTSSVMECPPSNFECPLQSTKLIRQVQWQTARLPATHILVWAFACTSAANQAESEKITLYSSLSLEIDYESLTVEHTLKFRRLRTSDSFYAVGEEVFVRRW